MCIASQTHQTTEIARKMDFANTLKHSCWHAIDKHSADRHSH